MNELILDVTFKNPTKPSHILAKNLREHLESKLEKLEGYFVHPFHIHSIFHTEKTLLELTLHAYVGHHELKSIGRSRTWDAAIDSAVKKFAVQIKKLKDLKKDKKHPSRRRSKKDPLEFGLLDVPHPKKNEFQR